MMKKLLVAFACLAACAAASFAQKGKAGGDFYPLGYAGDTWTGEVTAFDNEQRTLTLTHGSGKSVQTFVASLPDAPYEWARDVHNARVLDFPYDKKAKIQVFKYDGPGRAATVMPDTGGVQVMSQIMRRPNPPDSDRITDFADFKGRLVTVYYTPRKRETAAGSEEYNDVWRVRIYSGKKK
jgi:hypothetical protein